MTDALRHYGNMSVVLSVLLLLSSVLVPMVVVGSAAGDYTWVKVFWHVTPCRLGNFLTFVGAFANCEKPLLGSSCVRLSVGKDQLRSHWTDFQKICYVSTTLL
jgi:steroid 5-alpha reductase family enzyme